MRESVHANTVYTGDPVYSRHFVASRIDAPATVGSYRNNPENNGVDQIVTIPR